MQAQSSVTVSGGRCKKRRRWCRELKWGSIFCGRGGVAATATTRANSRKRNFLSSEVTAQNSNCLFLFLFPAVRKPATQDEKLRQKLQCSALADPAAAENDVAVVKNSGLAGCDGALRRVKRDARGGGGQRLDDSRCRFVLVADLGERAKRAGRAVGGNPIHAF